MGLTLTTASGSCEPEPRAQSGAVGLPGFSPAVERFASGADRLRLSDQTRDAAAEP